jgi:hypothetical protein
MECKVRWNARWEMERKVRDEFKVREGEIWNAR